MATWSEVLDIVVLVLVCTAGAFPSISLYLANLAAFLASSDWNPPKRSALDFILASLSIGDFADSDSTTFPLVGSFSLPLDNGSTLVSSGFAGLVMGTLFALLGVDALSSSSAFLMTSSVIESSLISNKSSSAS